MIGILSAGAYVPPTRLPLGAIGGRKAKEGGPEKAVAWADEDSITMGVAAALNCLAGLDRSEVAGVLFATTTHPFAEKQGAALIARALDLEDSVRTADFGGSLRAGTEALRAAFDAVRAGSAGQVLVIASDSRLAAPGSPLEANFGDGAAAFLVGDGDVIATLDDAATRSDAIVDVWRSNDESFVHSWEDRFVVQEGYTPRMREAVAALLESTGKAITDFTKVALYGPDKRSHGGLAKALRLSAGQLVDPLFGRVGNAGTAAAPIQLAFALESLQAGESVLLANYGDGAEALAFSAGSDAAAGSARRSVSWHLDRGRSVNYDQYLSARGLKITEWERPKDPGLSATVHFRGRDDELSFKGQKCRACGAVQFPAQRVCESCFAKDDFDKVRLSDRVGTIVTYTFDFFFPTPEPPTVVSIIEIDGARIHMQIANCRPDDVKLGLPVDFTFRRIHEVGGRPNYYWKATLREEAA